MTKHSREWPAPAYRSSYRMQKDQFKMLPVSWGLILAESVSGGNDIKKTIKSSPVMLHFLMSSNRLEGCNESLEKLRWIGWPKPRDILKSLYSAYAVEEPLQLTFSAQNPTFNRLLNQASRFYWYPNESFLKSGLERTMLF